jgi:hypothetical protein
VERFVDEEGKWWVVKRDGKAWKRHFIVAAPPYMRTFRPNVR